MALGSIWPSINIMDRQALADATGDDAARIQAISAAWDAYFGRLPKPLKVRPGQSDDNVAVNYCRMIVDKGVSFLFGQDVRFELDETEQTAQEAWLQECWQANRGMVTLQKLALSGAMAGHAFAKIVPGRPLPRVVILDPASVRVHWDPEDLDKVVQYVIQYSSIDYRTSKVVAFRQRIEQQDNGRWRIIDELSESGGPWRLRTDTVWPWTWPPVVDCQNLPNPNEFWGVGDLEADVVQLNQSINFVLSNLNRIIRFHAHPKTWGRGFTATQLNVGVDETIVLPAADAELHNLEMQSDLGSSIALYERLREGLHQVTRVPEVATGKLNNAGALSGVALHILYQPLIEKTEVKRRTYGELLVELNRRMLALAGYGEEHRTIIHWPELIPSDPFQEAQTAALYQQLGVSSDTLLQRLGFDPDLEREKREVGTAELGEAMLTAFEHGE